MLFLFIYVLDVCILYCVALKPFELALKSWLAFLPLIFLLFPQNIIFEGCLTDEEINTDTIFSSIKLPKKVFQSVRQEDY